MFNEFLTITSVLPVSGLEHWIELGRLGYARLHMDFDALFKRLDASEFRRRFRLDAKDSRYLASRGLTPVLEHARGFLFERLAPAKPLNDGSQTPMRGHPAFVAQHATGTCCRSCLLKWHGLEKGRELTLAEIDQLVQVIGAWLTRQNIQPVVEDQLSLF